MTMFLPKDKVIVMSEQSSRVCDAQNDNTQFQIAQGSVLVKERNTHFQRDIYSDHHHLLADEPLSHDGTDLGFDPYELLMASLGACTSMTIRMFANRKQWPLDGVEVLMRHEKVQQHDENGMTQVVDKMHREVILQGALSEEQRARLLDVANKCPVHKTLTGQLRVDTYLKTDA